MNLRVVIKRIVSYILALALAFVFALYLNANVGWFMLIALILAPLMSVFFAWLTSKTISVQCNIEDGLLSKGDNCEMTVIVKNKSIFPTTPIELVVLNGDGVKSLDKNIICTVMPMSKQRVDVEFTANICGPSKIGIDKVKVTDYLGLIHFNLKKFDYEAIRKIIPVIPNIADVSLKDERILKIMHASQNADDSEDTVEANINTFGGFPGYDNREYVPGDPLKRINWKQSAKRDKLLVRLDDEMASQSVNVVLDSVFKRQNLNVTDVCYTNQYMDATEDDILPRIAEDAIENALGIAEVLVSSNYNVNFYAKKGDFFVNYELEDEKDIEAVRMAMAEYSFSEYEYDERFPINNLISSNGVFIVSTPNSSNDVCIGLEEKIDISNTSIFSVADEVENSSNEDITIPFVAFGDKRIVNSGIKDKIKQVVSPLVVPYLLSLVLSVTVFAIYNVSPLSLWTILQVIVCALAYALCNYVKNHKVVGAMIITILVMGLLTGFMTIASTGEGYLKWFMSGGDLIENNFTYLLSLVLVFSVFFSMIVYYYTQVLYRTSILFLTAMIPFIIYVKVMRDIEIIYVMVVIILNVIVFLMNTRKSRDKNKRIVGFYNGVFSVVLYGLLFVMIALAVPKGQETKYYYIFEELFLGGNTSMELPDEYMVNNDFSGNADNYNQLTNRKMYEISGIRLDNPLYLRRQTFDYYDFENDRWYGDKYYSEYIASSDMWSEEKSKLNNELLADAMVRAEELQPGFLEKYGLETLLEYDFIQNKKAMQVQAQNFASDFCLTPVMTEKIIIGDGEKIYVSLHEIFGKEGEFFHPYFGYEVYFYDQFKVAEEWITLGGANYDNQTSSVMLSELEVILEKNNEDRYKEVASAFLDDLMFAMSYSEQYQDNNEEIPASVRQLALEITKDYKYDWEKAQALQSYFWNSGFIYDIEYDAPDDSVEYFLFESKTGTCSDFASAYVLMARAAGLIVRYVEGFVPDTEIGLDYEPQYIVRTKTSHAYPEVYIQNLGFVVFEPTIPSLDEDDGFNGGAVAFVMTLGFRILLIFAAVSIVIIVILFMTRMLLPVIREKHFMSQIRKAKPEKAVVMLYKRMLNKYSGRHMENVTTNTPYEYAEKFEAIAEYDISPLSYMVEKAVYENGALSERDKSQAKDIYMNAIQAIKKAKKSHRK